MLRILLVVTMVCTGLNPSDVSSLEALVFDKQWDAYYKQLSTEEPELMPTGWRNLIIVPPPPDDAFTRNEVDYIINLQPLRHHYQSAIEAELTDVVYPFTHSLQLTAASVTALRAFWETLVPDITRVHMYYKAIFNRARPRQYSKKIAPSIAPPGHPAYPSGHSTDSYTLALLLADIWPDRKSQLLSIAFQIAMNREIGGVHYRSDTAAGYLLAQQIVALLPRNPKASELIAELKAALAGAKPEPP